MKIRRGEDWRRSRRNKTISTSDVPNAHRAGTFVAVARWFHTNHRQANLWASHHEAAYRQVAVQDPDETYVPLRIAGGWTLWRHHCLLFRSAASVWSYTRVADFITWLGRALTLAPVVHYVDDYACVEASQTSQSSYKRTHQTLETLGFKLKESKLQPPQESHKIQGIQMTVHPTEFNMSPAPLRLERAKQNITEILNAETLTPSQAHKIAGKLQFLQEAIAGQGMRACIHPLWKFATAGCYSLQARAVPQAVRDALPTLLLLLDEARPRRCPFVKSKVAIVYADAFFKAGEKVIRLQEAAENWDWNPEASNLLENGWGFIIRVPG